MTSQPLNRPCGVDVLIAGRPLFRTTTHLIVDARDGRLVSQHRSEKSAASELVRRKGCAGFDSLKVLPVSAALAAVEGQS
jgi:hypothetical protein